MWIIDGLDNWHADNRRSTLYQFYHIHKFVDVIVSVFDASAAGYNGGKCEMNIYSREMTKAFDLL